MENVLPLKILMKGTLNGILTGLGKDADEITNDDFPEEGIDLLRKAYLYYYKDEQSSANALAKLKSKNHPDYEQIKSAMNSDMITYAMINDMFELDGSFFRDFKSGGLAEDLKMVLGNFTVKANVEDGVSGFRIYDKYDYPNNDKWFQGSFPEIFNDVKEAGFNTEGPLSHIIMSAKAGIKNVTDSNAKGFINNSVAAFYPLLHTVGGWAANENRPDDEKLNVNVFIPFERSELVADGSVNPVEMPVAEDMPEPMSRPETLQAVIPNGPMDKQRASLLDQMFDFFIPKAEASTMEQPVAEQPVAPVSFGNAFKQAKADGLKEFEFTNKEGKTGMYTTEVAQ